MKGTTAKQLRLNGFDKWHVADDKSGPLLVPVLLSSSSFLLLHFHSSSLQNALDNEGKTVRFARMTWL